MAAVLREKLKSIQVATINKCNSPLASITRTLARSPSQQGRASGWVTKLLVRRILPAKKSHSRMLSDKETIYALHTQNIRPDSIDKYLVNYEEHVKLMESKKDQLKCELIGSWTVEVGDLDQAIHLWQYNGGYNCIDHAQILLAGDEAHQKLQKERGNYLRSQHLQYLLGFSYWPPTVQRTGGNKYEIRSYSLMPGTMIEWGNNWARAINHRRNNDEPFAGYFSQVGHLYNVHHIWCYKNLQSRKETRESAWRSPGWDECVAYTVPLIQEMHSRILSPTTFSPTQ